MTTWRWDVDDEGYFSAPQDIEVRDWYSDRDVAEEAADKYYRENDGWEDDWPVAFRIYKPDSDEYVVIRVYMDYDPVFSASYESVPEES